MPVKIKHAPSLKAGLECLSQGGFDVILLEIDLPDTKGMEAFYKIHAQARDFPLIILTHQDIQTFALQAVREGAQDYLLKSEVDGKLLSRIIFHAIERTQSEKAMRASEEGFRRLAEATMEAVVVCDKGKIEALNQAFSSMFGYLQQEVLGTSFTGYAAPEFRETLQENVLSENEDSFECVFLRKDQSTFYTEVRGRIIPYQGRMAKVIAIRDISERKQLEQLKDEFVSTVSHELRTPMTVIREGVSQILDGLHGDTTPAQRQFLNHALSNIDRLRRIIDDLLDISKIEAGKMEIRRDLVDLVSVAKEVCASFSVQTQKKGLDLRTSFRTDKAELYLDRDKIIQVFTNLIGNALKFTATGWIEVSVADKEQHVECRVSDTGKGIAERDLPKVFGKFQQFGRTAGQGEKGTGLGLAVSKGIVELHQGKIWVESKIDIGTKFIFTLPKCSVKDIFKEYIGRGIKEASKHKTAASIAVFEVKDFEDLMKKMEPERLIAIVNNLDSMIRAPLRPKLDVSTRNGGTILVVLLGMKRQDTFAYARSILWAFDVYLSQEKLDGKIKITYEVTTFPEDANTEDELLNKLLHNP